WRPRESHFLPSSVDKTCRHSFAGRSRVDILGDSPGNPARGRASCNGRASCSGCLGENGRYAEIVRNHRVSLAARPAPPLRLRPHAAAFNLAIVSRFIPPAMVKDGGHETSADLRNATPSITLLSSGGLRSAKANGTGSVSAM